MASYTNTDDQQRIWIGLQNADGTTVSLEPGGSVELDLPDDFDDPYLKPAQGNPASAKTGSPPAPPITDADASTPKE